MPRQHPREAVLDVVAARGPLPAAAVAAAVGIAPREAVAHLRILRARGSVCRLLLAPGSHAGAEWVLSFGLKVDRVVMSGVRR